LALAQTPDQAGREADRRLIVAGEHAWGQAYITGDVATAARLLADDFAGVNPRGATYTKAEVLKDVAETPHDASDAVGPVTVRFYGDAAIAQAHEHEVGPALEFKPVDHVFTDTWVKAGGQWRIVAAEDLDPGAPTLPAYAEDKAAILALRATSNRAIAAHDLAAFTPVFADDAVFVWSNGTSAVGKAGLKAWFAKDFADPAFVTYIRTPETVAISDQGVRAVEHGTWTAIKREPRGETRYGGDYAAHWFKTAEGWRVRGELYVKLRCAGPLCTP
jgi:uncharacterized protein (TIGR02246 family)